MRERKREGGGGTEKEMKGGRENKRKCDCKYCIQSGEEIHRREGER